MTSKERREPAEKLTDLLETLEPDDRRELTAWLLGRGTPGLASRLSRDAILGLQHSLRTSVGEDLLAGRDVATGLVSGENSQLVTVRLPSAQHERLRDWCNDHNFTMAAVVRGLIERFLDGQDRPATR
jgi:hypothetical protein